MRHISSSPPAKHRRERRSRGRTAGTLVAAGGATSILALAVVRIPFTIAG